MTLFPITALRRWWRATTAIGLALRLHRATRLREAAMLDLLEARMDVDLEPTAPAENWIGVAPWRASALARRDSAEARLFLLVAAEERLAWRLREIGEGVGDEY